MIKSVEFKNFRNLNSIILLKGFPSFIASSEEDLYINLTGNESASTAGTGDILAGICTSLIAQGLTPKDSVICGIYLAGLCSDNYTKKYRQNSMIASDLLDELKRLNNIKFVFRRSKIICFTKRTLR